MNIKFLFTEHFSSGLLKVFTSPVTIQRELLTCKDFIFKAC